VLGLSDADAVLAAIAKIGAGAREPAIARYAERLGVDPGSIRMAVLVQSLAPATAAGVAFSQDPLGAAQVRIEANHGLGSTVVDGSVEPDSFSVRDGEILARTLGAKRQKDVLGSGDEGVLRVDAGEAERSSFALDDDGVLAVAGLARRLEADLGHPVDVEWAYAGSRLLLLQARPSLQRGQVGSAR
jgi:pyruvate,water dikinase